MKTATQFANEIGSTIAEAVDKHGKPSFISLPTAGSFMDTQAQSMVQLAQHKQNLEQTAAYAEHFKNEANYYDKNKTLPVPGAIGASFTKKPIFNEIRDKWSKEIESILPQEFLARAAKNSAPKIAPAKEAAKPVAPPKESLPSDVPKGSVAHGWTPSGKRVYKAPDGSLHTGD